MNTLRNQIGLSVFPTLATNSLSGCLRLFCSVMRPRRIVTSVKLRPAKLPLLTLLTYLLFMSQPVALLYKFQLKALSWCWCVQFCAVHDALVSCVRTFRVFRPQRSRATSCCKSRWRSRVSSQLRLWRQHNLGNSQRQRSNIYHPRSEGDIAFSRVRLRVFVCLSTRELLTH